MFMNDRIDPLLKTTRRHFFKDCGVGVGKIALASLLAEQFGGRLVQGASAGNTPTSSSILAARPSHYRGRAKAVIQLFMAGAPSQLDMFDYKPELEKLEGKPLPPSVYA